MKIIKTIQTRKTNKVFHQEIENLEFNKDKDLLDNIVRVDTSKKFQTIQGFGGAFTEASAIALNYLDKDMQEKIIDAYFGKDGLNYNLGRVHINSCDFAKGNYTYIKDGDDKLTTFDLSHDKKEIFPFVIKASTKAQDKLLLLASPWSPPAFMKTNKNMNYGGKLLKEYYKTWADYFVKYIKEAKKLGIDISMVTVQNEPQATQTWDSCIYEPEDEKEFVKNYLGPAFIKNNLPVDIYIWDHNRGDVLVDRAIRILDDKKASKYIKGLAFHWYCSEDFESLSKFHNMYPNKSLLFTEGCVEYGVYGDESKYRFENGEKYAHHMINDFNNYSEGFIDWNLLLDEQGGVNHVGNYCEAPIMINRKTKEVIYNSSYYYIGHFSKYVKRGARRVLTTTLSKSKTIEAVSFINPNGETIIIILNTGWIDKVSLVVDGNIVNITLPNQSITTYIIN